MLRIDEAERCYTGIASPNGVAIHFFDGEVLQPIAPRYTFACGHRWGGAVEERENVAFTVLGDYLQRHNSSREAAELGAEALMRAFAEQFLTDIDPRSTLFIEEHHIEDWLRVMRMLGEAA